MSGSRRTVLMPGGTDGINRWWDSGGELFGIVCYMRGEVSVTRLPHAAAPDAPWVQIVARHPVQGAEWDEREDYTVWTSRQGHPVHQGRLLSRWLLLVPPCSPQVPSPPSSFPLPAPTPWSSAFFTLLFSGPSLRHPLRCADTSQQPTTSYYSKVISLSTPLGTLPSFISAEEINQEDISMVSLYRVRASFLTRA